MSWFHHGMVEPIPALTGAAKIAADILTEPEAAELLSVEPRTLRLWRHTRGLPHYKLTAKVIRYRRGDLIGWMDRCRVATRRGAR